MAGRWSGFVADGEGAKALHEVDNPDHRVRIEHDRDRLFINLSDEDGKGWTVIAIERRTREYGVGQHRTQKTAAALAADALTNRDSHLRSPAPG